MQRESEVDIALLAALTKGIIISNDRLYERLTVDLLNQNVQILLKQNRYLLYFTLQPNSQDFTHIHIQSCVQQCDVVTQ